MRGDFYQNVYRYEFSLLDVIGDEIHNAKSFSIADGVVYKFIHKRDAHFLFADETVKISNSAVFRRDYHAMEVKNPRINDPSEGTMNALQDHFIADGLTESENFVYSELEPFHLISFARGDLRALSNHFCSPDIGIDDPYDCAIEFLNFEKFLHALAFDSYWGLLGQKPEMPSISVLDGLKYLDVLYQPVHFKMSESVTTYRPARPSPFVKDSSFFQQSEFRVVFVPLIQLPETSLAAYVPGLKDLIKFHDLSQLKLELSTRSLKP